MELKRGFNRVSKSRTGMQLGQLNQAQEIRPRILPRKWAGSADGQINPLAWIHL